MKNRLLVYGIGVIVTFALLFGFNYDKVKEKHNAKEADKKTAEVVSKKQDGKIPFPETDEDIEEYKLYIQGKVQATTDKKESYAWIESLSDSERQALLDGASIQDIHKKHNAESYEAEKKKGGILSSITSFLGLDK